MVINKNARIINLFSTVAMFFILVGGFCFYYLYKFYENYSFNYRITVFFIGAALSFCFVYFFPTEGIKKKGLLDHPVFVSFFLLFMVLINKANVLNLPFYWDEQWTLGHADIIFKNHLWPFAKAVPFDTGHPFFYFEYLAFLWKIFGQKVFVSHLAALAFSWMALFYIYRIGSDFLKDARVGFFAAILFFYSPTMFTHSGTVVLDVPLAALFLASTHALWRRQYFYFSFFSTFAVLTKSYGVLLIGALLLVNFFIFKFYENDKLRLKRFDSLFLCSPFIFYALWFIGHYYSSGILFYSEIFGYYNSLQASGSYVVLRAVRIFQHFFLFGNIFLAVIIFYHLTLDIAKHKSLGIIRIFSFIILVLAILFLSFVKNFSARWLIPFYPFFYFLAALSLVRLLDESKNFIFKLVFYVTILFSLMRYDINGWALDSVVYNNEYVDAVTVSRDAARYIESNFSEEHILTTWPFMAALRHPVLGYVKKPLHVVNNHEKFDIFVYDRHSLESEKLLEQKEFFKNNCFLLKRFEKNDFVIEIYRVV